VPYLDKLVIPPPPGGAKPKEEGGLLDRIVIPPPPSRRPEVPVGLTGLVRAEGPEAIPSRPWMKEALPGRPPTVRPEVPAERRYAEGPEPFVSSNIVDLTPDPQRPLDPSGSVKNPIAKSILNETQRSIGPVIVLNGIVTVDQESLKKQETRGGKYSLTIDPNINQGWVINDSGKEVFRFHVATGDTTGTKYGNKYFTPTGYTEIAKKLEFSEKDKIYQGEDWGKFFFDIGIPSPKDEPIYALHGPIEEDPSGEFKNKGFLSHGCIRLSNRDLDEVSKYLNVGSEVEILRYTTGKRSPLSDDLRKVLYPTGKK